MEDAIKKIDGVEDASVNFIMQKMTITAQKEDFESIMPKVIKVCSKIEPDCEIQYHK